jgi:hypothetical protein
MNNRADLLIGITGEGAYSLDYQETGLDRLRLGCHDNTENRYSLACANKDQRDLIFSVLTLDIINTLEHYGVDIVVDTISRTIHLREDRLVGERNRLFAQQEARQAMFEAAGVPDLSTYV